MEATYVIKKFQVNPSIIKIGTSISVLINSTARICEKWKMFYSDASESINVAH